MKFMHIFEVWTSKFKCSYLILILSRKNATVVVVSKGQTKSKWFFQADVSSKKWMNEFDFTNFRSFFWKKLKTPKRHFKINWPSVLELYFLFKYILLAWIFYISWQEWMSHLKSVHFKNTVTRSSFCSKLWSFSIIHQLTLFRFQLKMIIILNRMKIAQLWS